MPDITMCPGTVGDRECPQKDKCYRHTAFPSYHQSYFMELPMKEDKTCENYWDNRPYTRKQDHHKKDA